jgi:hypothetical protein
MLDAHQKRFAYRSAQFQPCSVEMRSCLVKVLKLKQWRFIWGLGGHPATVVACAIEAIPKKPLRPTTSIYGRTQALPLGANIMLDTVSSHAYVDEIRTFEDSGFIILTGAVSAEQLLDLHMDLAWLAASMFKTPELIFDPNNPADFVERLSKAQDNSPAVFRDYIGKASELRSFHCVTFCNAVQQTLSSLSKAGNFVLLSGSSGLLFNKPGCEELQYRWHQEWPYFPSHDTGFHVWFPLFQDIAMTGGSMLLAAGTHRQKLNYKQSRQPNSYLQNETLFDVTSYDVISCDLNLGDIVIFHHNTVHCTDQSIKSTPRVSGVARFVGNEHGAFVSIG